VGDHVLLLAQVDDCSGEVLGEALTQLVAMGARNVQLLNSLTKKGRPGSVLLLDIERDLEPDVALFLAAELGVWGYHVLQSSHRHFDVSIEQRRIQLISGDSSHVFDVRCKFLKRRQELLRVKLEHADVVKMVSFARSSGYRYSLSSMRARVEQEVWSRPDEPEFELRI
jgi:uncharacterized protein (DUF111 family)